MATVTVNQIIDTISNFISNVEDTSKSYYLFVGKPTPWLNSNGQVDDSAGDVPAANNSVEQTELSLYQDLSYGKLIFSNNISYMIPNYQWTNNTTYAQYSQYDGNLINEKFFVVTDAGEVYKCIYNNNGANSIVKPALNTPSGNFITVDGYIWKYMYTISSIANSTFTSNTYVPVTINANVQSNAVPGTIDYLALTNPGQGYEVYEEGFLAAVVNNYVVQLPSTSSPQDNYYTGSSIYLKAGGGAGQISNVVNYSGTSKQILVNPPFISYVNLGLANVTSSNVVVGDVVTQNLVSLSYVYPTGYFNIGDTVYQSVSGYNGVVSQSNSSGILLQPNTAASQWSNLYSYPIYDTSHGGLAGTGTVSVVSGNTVVSVVGNTTINTSVFAVGTYVQVGNSGGLNQFNIRRITASNTTSITVNPATPFSNTLVANVYYSIPYAAEPSSLTSIDLSGQVVYTNLTGQSLNISNTTPAGVNFIPGELVTQVDVNNVNQAANGVVSFSNSSVLILSNVSGTLTANLYMLGASSNARAYIVSVNSYPNITVTSPGGDFLVGENISIYPTACTVPVSSATVVSYAITPNELTEYVISPKVTISGDGNGAVAYAYVDTSGNNLSRQISDIVLINNGQNYTYANISISSNNSYGSGAALSAAISPALGHGANVYSELGAKYVGVSMTFGNGYSESYRYPLYGSYRRIGILESPEFQQVYLNLSSFTTLDVAVSNTQSNSFAVGETVFQPSTNAAGTVLYANSSFLQLTGVQATLHQFSNTNNNKIVGLTSNTTANVTTSNIVYFSVYSDVETLKDKNTLSTGTITQAVTNTTIQVSNVTGHINTGDIVYDPVTNASASVVSIYTANDTVDSSANFVHSFVQTGRITLTSNNRAFSLYETVTQAVTNAYGTVVSTNTDIDLAFTSSNGTIFAGQTLTDANTGATAIVTYVANNSYVRCTAANGVFIIGDTVTNNLNIGGALAGVYTSLVLSDVVGTFQVGNNAVTGASSAATGVPSLAKSITYPDLTRNSGKVLYLENLTPFTRSNTSSEKINIVIQF